MRMFEISSISLIEAGFLFSVFFEPWGPVFRYFGWLLCLVGLSIMVFRGEGGKIKAFVEPVTKKLMLATLLWSLLVTFVNTRGLYFDLKGLSVLIEAFFAVWLSSFVITRHKGALGRFIAVWTASFVCVCLWSLWLAFDKGHFAGPFSNVNTMGLYSIVVLPIILYQAMRKRRSLYLEFFYIALFAGNVLLVFLSFSSCAWLAGATLVASFFLVVAKHERQKVLKVLVASCVIFAILGGYFVLEDGKVLAYAKREVSQLMSVNGDVTKFTNHRNIIWKAVLRLWREKPLTGWGWSDFQHLAETKIGKLPKVGVPMEPHNFYIELLVKGGPLLLFLGAFLFFRGAQMGYRKVKLSSDLSSKLFYAVLFAAIVAQSVFGLGGSILAARQKIGFLFWTLYGLAVAEKPKSEGV